MTSWPPVGSRCFYGRDWRSGVRHPCSDVLTMFFTLWDVGKVTWHCYSAGFHLQNGTVASCCHITAKMIKKNRTYESLDSLGERRSLHLALALLPTWNPEDLSQDTGVSVFLCQGKEKKMSQLERSILQQKLNKHCKKKYIYKVMLLEILYFMEDEYSVFYILVLSETGFISLQSKRLSRVFSSTTVQKHQWNCRKTKTQK